MRIKYLIIALALVLAAPAIAQFSKSTVSSQISSQFPDNTTGQITPSTTRTFLNNLLNSYQQYAGLNKQTGTTYTIQGSDYGQLVTFANGSTVNVTLSPGNSSGFTTFNFYAQNISSGNVVIAPSAGTICGNSVLTLANTQSAWVISDGTNYQCVFELGGSQFTLPLTVSNGGTAGSVASGTLLDNITGFTSTGFVVRSGAGSYAFQSTSGGITLSNIGNLSALTTLCNPTNVNATAQACSPGQMSAVLCTPTVTNFTTATNTTYTTPTCNGVRATWLDIQMVGGGGGGAGSGTTPGAATAGTASCWKTSGTACSSPDFQAAGGSLGSTSSAGTASGGAATSCDTGITGGNGGPATSTATAFGGIGGASFFGGQGPGGQTGSGSAAGVAATANSGSGGGGGADFGTANSGGGGGAGAYCRKLLLNPASSYVTTVGTHGNGGTLGTGGAAGGNGGDGYVQVWAHWQ